MLTDRTAADDKIPDGDLTDKSYTACCYQGDSADCSDVFPDVEGHHTCSRSCVH